MSALSIYENICPEIIADLPLGKFPNNLLKKILTILYSKCTVTKKIQFVSQKA